MVVFRLVSVILILLGLLVTLINGIITKKNNNPPKKKRDNHDFCFLIPARDESLVIEGLLKSIKNQTHKVNMKDVYVIVESKEDKTVSITKRYNANVVLRKDLSKQRKGYALDDAVKEILASKKSYDAYFIFDADNTLDKDFVKNMIPVFDKGYDIASGYRNCKNGNQSVVAASSALTFSLVNTVFNKKKNENTRNITFSGTGFYIRGYLIEKWKGYPFSSLTEDYEISQYATLHNLTTYYNVDSVFYDEQPVKFKNTINQRIRWIRGYFDVRGMYFKKIVKSISKNDKNKGSKIDESVGILPYILIVLGLVIWFLALVFFIVLSFLLNDGNTLRYLVELVIYFAVVYLALFSMTVFIVILEGNKINLSLKMKLKVVFYNPIFMISYVPCAFRALTLKEVKWTKVPHGN